MKQTQGILSQRDKGCQFTVKTSFPNGQFKGCQFTMTGQGVSIYHEDSTKDRFLLTSDGTKAPSYVAGKDKLEHGLVVYGVIREDTLCFGKLFRGYISVSHMENAQIGSLFCRAQGYFT